MKASLVVSDLPRQFEREFADYPRIAAEAGRMAVNDGARFLARESSREIRKSLAFDPKELWSAANPVGGKISTLLASPKTLVARVKGQDKPTLLGRFATNFGKGRKIIPRVRVKPGSNKEVSKRAFFLSFKNGARGLAIRLKKGERLLNHRGPTYPLRGDPNVLVLYAPSVDQALQTAGADLLDRAADVCSDSFVRNFNRLNKNG